MNISTSDQIAKLSQPQEILQGAPTAERLRQVAVQFEAILLMQLTSALNSTANEDEDQLFGGDAGAGMAKQLFSEQMATSLAQSGGVGIADMMVRQIAGEKAPQVGGIKGLSDIVSSVRLDKDVRMKPLDKSGGIQLPVRMTARENSPLVQPGEVEIISTFEDDLRTNGIDDATENLMLDGRVVNSTRSRVVPGIPITSLDGSTPIARLAGDIKFQRPLSGRVSSQFGTRFHPIDKTTKFHAGLDIAVATGTTVGSAADGTVSYAGWSGGYGNLVIIDHPDGRQTRYAHLSSISVSAGEQVSQGQRIALSGSTGKSTGPHLHFEVRENGRPVDPTRILSNVLSKPAEK